MDITGYQLMGINYCFEDKLLVIFGVNSSTSVGKVFTF